jgi:hypothetical protein
MPVEKLDDCFNASLRLCVESYSSRLLVQFIYYYQLVSDDRVADELPWNTAVPTLPY